MAIYTFIYIYIYKSIYGWMDVSIIYIYIYIIYMYVYIIYMHLKRVLLAGTCTAGMSDKQVDDAQPQLLEAKVEAAGNRVSGSMTRGIQHLWGLSSSQSP